VSDLGGWVDLIDDDASIRRSLGRALKLDGFAVRTFESAEAFVRAGPAAGEPACLLLDLRMPQRGGLELQRDLLESGTTVPVIFLTGHGDVASSVRAMKNGAVDFLLKPVSHRGLVAAIRNAHERHLHDLGARRERAALARRWGTLTPREREVLEWVVRGAPNKRIAVELGTVEKTIKVHRARVMEKMGVVSLADLVRAAAKLEVSTPVSGAVRSGLD
jgi:FixJ family two-component response regulator